MREFDGSTEPAQKVLTRRRTRPARVLDLVTQSSPRLTYKLYLPRRPAAKRPVLVAVHGVSRNAQEQIDLFRPWAERCGVTLVAPLFSRDVFRDYQRLGRKGLGPRADFALIRMLNEVQRHTGCDSSRVDMFGFSGGAQFAHRFAFAYPQRIRNLALGAAGWYTMPDRSAPYPYGIAEPKGLAPVRFHPALIARLSVLVAVGELDDKDDEELNQAELIRTAQGSNRVERARRWTEAMQSLAARHDAGREAQLAMLPKTGHSFRQAVRRGGLAKLIFEHFYPLTERGDQAAVGGQGAAHDSCANVRQCHPCGLHMS